MTTCGDVGLLHETNVDVVVVYILGHVAIRASAFVQICAANTDGVA